jgi:outer membrane protein OmpA-like peptidoglycan-associated protein
MLFKKRAIPNCLLSLSFLIPYNGLAQNVCLQKVSTEYAKGGNLCDGPSPTSYRVIYKNICTKKIDIVFALQETSKHWVRFEKDNVNPNDTMTGFVCSYTGKSQTYFRESGDKSEFPSYREMNKEYYELNGIKLNGNATTIYAKLYVILKDDARIAWENTKSNGDNSTVNTFLTDRYGVGNLIVDLNKDVSINLGKFKILEEAKKVAIFRGGKEFQFDVIKNVKGEYGFKITKENAKVLLMTTTNLDNFAVKLLVGDKVKEPLANQKVFYQNRDGEKKSAITDQFGDFNMKKINVSDKVEIELEKSGQLENIQKVFIASTGGIVMSEMKRSANGEFKYDMLPQIISEMEQLYDDEDDPYLKIREFKESKTEKEITIHDNILYDRGSAEVNATAAKSLDELVQVLKDNPDLNVFLISHTDARGDDASNMSLSEKRAKNSVKYIVSKGIPASRVAGKGEGETMIANRCGNGISCSEQEHAANRRTEFKFIKNKF